MKARFWCFLAGLMAGFALFTVQAEKKDEDFRDYVDKHFPGESHGVWEGTNNDD